MTRYTRALVGALACEHPRDEWLLFVPGSGPLPALGGLRGLPNVSVRRSPLPGRLLFGAAALARRPRLDRLIGAPDVVWAPTIAPVALSAEVPFVLTVQDLSFELRPQDFTPYERLWHVLARPRALTLRARLVIVLAPPTRDQLVARWRLDTERVRVVAPGVHRPQAPVDPGGALDRLRLAPGGYLLAVGALEPRKAPLLLARAFARARQRGLVCQLVFAGDGRLADQLGAPGVRLVGQVSDGDLDALYAGARALVAPSLLEGYGLHVREALARGVPAVVSDLPVFGEELSDAVLRVPVGDEMALADALLRIDREEGLRESMARAGEAAVAGLTWSAAARQTRAVLAQACAGAA